MIGLQRFFHSRSPEGEFPSLRHRLQGIETEIEKNLLHPLRIDQNLRQVFVEGLPDFYLRFGSFRLHEKKNILNHLPDITGGPLCFRRPGKGGEGLQKMIQPVNLPEDPFQKLVMGAVGADFFKEELNIGFHPRQWIPDLMGNAGRKPPHRGHLFRLNQLFRSFPNLRLEFLIRTFQLFP